MTKYFDQTGQERDATWLEATFGQVAIVGRSDIYEVAELRAITGPASIVVTVQSADGTPQVGKPVTFSWPDGEVPGHTDGGGACGFGLGGGAWYKPDEVSGPHWVTCDDLTVSGLGMVFGTNHQTLNPTYRAKNGEPSLEPPGPPDSECGCAAEWQALFSRVDEIISLLEARVS